MSSEPQILVIGGGIGGVAMTRALGLAGKEVLLVEQAREFGEIGARSTPSPTSRTVARSGPQW